MYNKSHNEVIISPFPLSPPPAITPNCTDTNTMVRNITMSMLRNCLHHFIYVWTKNEDSFWMFPTAYTQDHILCGYKWDCELWKFYKIRYVEIVNFY